MDFEKLADLLFPDVVRTPADLETEFPPRALPEDAKVTRFSPSPTGFVHFGGMFPVMIGERLAHQSGGVFYLRIEDTDAKREVPGAAQGLITTLSRYGVHFDEGAAMNEAGEIVDKGAYGPYKQSVRGSIYHVFAKQLVREGKAYPCFMDEEAQAELAATDKKTENKTKDWHDAEEKQREAQAKMRNFTMEEVEASLAKGEPFVLRLLSDGDASKKTPFTDLVKGKLEIPENEEDFVLLKSDGIPTYHFAHVVDDHLMRTTHVVRGEEWLPSLAKHLMLFRYLGLKLPKFLHISQLMRLDEEGNKKKLSKRDMGANLDDYDRLGYAADCVCEYVMTLLNSNYEEWHMQNPDKPYTDFPFSIKKMSASGCLFDFDKLNDVSRNVISRMSADKIFDLLLAWAEKYDEAFAKRLAADPAFAKAIISIGRGGKKPRKDYATWAELRDYMAFFYDETFAVTEEIGDEFAAQDVKAALTQYLESYDDGDDMNGWFEKIKAIADGLGYASDMKAYKQDPDAYRGNVADISMFIRVAVTGKKNAPDLYTVIHILGADRANARVRALLDTI